MTDAPQAAALSRVLGPLTSRWYDALAGWITREAPSATRILDVGTGAARLIDRLCIRYPAAAIYGIDSSAAMLHIARRMSPPASAPTSLVRASFYDLPFRSRSFDLVTATGILHHVDAPAKLFEEVRRVLADGGRLMISAFRRDATAVAWRLAAAHSWWSAWRHSSEGFYWVLKASWTRSEIESALRASGYRQFTLEERFVQLRVVAVAG